MISILASGAVAATRYSSTSRLKLQYQIAYTKKGTDNGITQGQTCPCDSIAGIDGATGVAQVSGGGGTSNDMPWRDKDEEFLDWARRAMRYAHAKHYPGNRLKRSLSK